MYCITINKIWCGCCRAGENKGEGNRSEHIHAKEWLPASGGEPVRTATLHHILLHPADVQPPAAVPPLQPHHASGLVGHSQLHRPHAGKNLPAFKGRVSLSIIWHGIIKSIVFCSCVCACACIDEFCWCWVAVQPSVLDLPWVWAYACCQNLVFSSLVIGTGLPLRALSRTD